MTYVNLNCGKDELAEVITGNINRIDQRLIDSADKLRREVYGTNVYFRGLIEFTNYCKNDCFYCGIRKSNSGAARYRLSEGDIALCCETGYKLGFRSFVLQGGDDEFFDKSLPDIIYSIKNAHPDCAVTISAGEKSRELYKEYLNAGADRYLLRHETASERHYKRLHPKSMELANRKKCLYILKDLGFQVGAGFMVGSPYQTVGDLADDLLFLSELQPHMVGIGPFIPHNSTPFKNYSAKSEYEISYMCKKYVESEKNGRHPLLNATIAMIALTRCLLPKAMLPSTTALASIAENGRELAIEAGANVVMPNLSPGDVRKNYELYNNKAFSGFEAAESVGLLSGAIKAIGYEPCFTRGDHTDFSLLPQRH